jgi:uncharacterized glyoxalase superfamily protein PhnB
MSTNPKPKGYAALKDPFGVAWAMNGPVGK